MYKYLAFHKPYAVLSKFTDSEGRKTLKDYIPIARVYPAGRLDFHSEGLLLLTDDGQFIKLVTDPRFNHPKNYLAQVEGIISAGAIKALQTRILLPGIQTKLVKVESIQEPDLFPRSKPVRDYHPTSWLKIILTEGKKHQVRRMTAAVGFPTLRLIRVSIGKISIGSLTPGEWRYLNHAEIKSIQSKYNTGFNNNISNQ
jgi:23S rRNA pseudouridine2457 synthase